MPAQVEWILAASTVLENRNSIATMSYSILTVGLMIELELQQSFPFSL
jgi:hypothetical protein